MLRAGGSSAGDYPTAQEVKRQRGKGPGREVARYTYHNEQGVILYWVVRFDPKAFAYCRPNGRGGEIWDIKGVTRVLYRLPEILDKPVVYVVEGEKDADRLWSLGIPSTTSPMGAKNWRSEYASALKGKQVVVIPDNDADGERYAHDVVRSLEGIATAVKIVRLPGLREHGDVSDWLDAGHTVEELREMVDLTPWGTDDGQPLALPEQADGPKAKSNPNALRVTLRHPSELVSLPISYLIEGILPAGMLTLLHARDKVGKTLLAWEMARAVLRNTPLFGQFPVSPGRVVLALLDDPTNLTVSRRDALGLTDCDNLRIVTPTDADLSEPEKFLADFHSICSEFKPLLIVIDSLYKFAPQGENSMNDNARMGRLMSKFDALAENLQTAVLLIAHDRKDGSDVAGSHVIRAAAKAVLHLTKTQRGNDTEEEDDGKRLLTVESKMTAEARFLLRCQGVDKWEYLGRADSAAQTRLTKAQADIRALLASGATGTTKVIAQRLKIRKEDAITVLEELEEEGQAKSEMVAPTGGGRGRRQRVYSADGNVIPLGQNGNEINHPTNPALNAGFTSPMLVQPAPALTGTKLTSQKAAKNKGSSDSQELSSRFPLSQGGNDGVVIQPQDKPKGGEPPAQGLVSAVGAPTPTRNAITATDVHDVFPGAEVVTGSVDDKEDVL